MSLPVSQYEELLATVRSLTDQTIRVHEIASDTIVTTVSSGRSSVNASPQRQKDQNDVRKANRSSRMDAVLLEIHKPAKQLEEDDPPRPDTRLSGASDPSPGPSSNSRTSVSALYHGTWPVDRNPPMWSSEPHPHQSDRASSRSEVTSIMSFASSSGGAGLDAMLSERIGGGQLEEKVDMVYRLLSMLGANESPDMGDTLLALSSSPKSCLAMRQSGCLPLLVELVHKSKDSETRQKASQTIQNLIQVQPDEGLRKQEFRVMRLLEQVRAYCNFLLYNEPAPSTSSKGDNHPSSVVANIMKVSFDEGHRHAICQLGGLHAIAQLIEVDHSAHGILPEEVTTNCILTRRYAGMALTNLTFADGDNKALLCSFLEFMKTLVAQLESKNEDVKQVTASVLRNLSWRADAKSKTILREVGAVQALVLAAMSSEKESTLKVVLSALWNLSSHCSTNKAEICSVPGALGFLVDLLSYKASSESLDVVENAGGILRNISNLIAIREDYRAVLRQHGCLRVLLDHLKSTSLTVVSNACGSLWNLSAKCAEDQKALCDLGAVPMLRSLNTSKHKMIAMGSSAALKNLLSSAPGQAALAPLDSTAKGMGLSALPSLKARKQKALVQELERSLAETYDEEHQAVNDVADGEQKSATSYRSEQPEETDYMETDLDQPTDYSLRYAEEDDEPEELDKKKDSYYEELEAELATRDTVKTYYTEGTPYETPFIFSTATSMSDLRIDPEKKEESSLQKDEKDQCSPGMAPETAKADKIVKYCEEGTPECLSRLDSLSPIGSCSRQTPEKATDTVDNAGDESVALNDEKDGKDGKVVTFGRVVNCAEETPLMFSRCSSLGSLGSQEPPSIHDDRSSVISDFSRLTSGIISPSELPDSPTQTVPPSPRQRRSHQEYPRAVRNAAITLPLEAEPSALPSVFDNQVKKFKDENTPSQFSCGTSLSSLTIDDEPKPPNPSFVKTVMERMSESKGKVDCGEKQDLDKEKKDENELAVVSEGEEDGEDDMLAACINIGMQNNMHRTSGAKFPSSPSEKQSGGFQSKLPTYKPSAGSSSGGRTPRSKNEACADTLHTYCTEDTPAALSNACSNSDLSALSLHDEDEAAVEALKPIKPALYDEEEEGNSSSSEILEECIKLAMPKPKKQLEQPQQVTVAVATVRSAPPGASPVAKPPRKAVGKQQQQQQPSSLPPYVAAKDETESFALEGSPGHFSLRSSFSDLTVDSSNVAGLKRLNSSADKQDDAEFFANGPSVSNRQSSSYQSEKDASYGEQHLPRVSLASEGRAAVLSRHNSFSSLSVESFGSAENAEQVLLEQCISSGMPKSHQQQREAHYSLVGGEEAAAGAADELDDGGDGPKNGNGAPAAAAGSPSGPAGEARDDAATGVVSEPSSGSDSFNNGTDQRIILDPDVMIASLDRFTAELVSQSSHLRQRNDYTTALTGSTTENDTWNEELSQNDISFPSISVSLPNPASENIQPSETCEKEPEQTPIPEANEDSNQFSSLNTPSTMSESTIIAMEAQHIASVMKLEADMSQSLDSMELDKIQPPSMMQSLASMNSSLDASPMASPKLPRRKKSLPVGLMVRRALASRTQHQVGPHHHCRSLDNSEAVDMEASMASVASITSEIAGEVRAEFVINGPVSKDVISVMNRSLGQHHCNSICDIENINPPSLMNEITDVANSVTICSETVFEDCYTHVVDETVDEVTEFSDANSVTPIQSDPSSPDLSPKKVMKNSIQLPVAKQLTPKQKRQLAKDRYRTYTIAAEMVIREEDQKRRVEMTASQQEEACDEVVVDSPSSSSCSSGKLTPRERRQNDKARFQTQLIDKSTLGQAMKAAASVSASPSPREVFRQKRAEHQDRFRTRTLSEDASSEESSPRRLNGFSGDALQDMLQHDSDVVLRSLKDTKGLLGHHDFLDCETISLVSTDDDSELASMGSMSYRTYHKSWKVNRNLPVVLRAKEDEEEPQKTAKGPKVAVQLEEEAAAAAAAAETADEKQKAVRGRRKPLYTGSPARKPPTPGIIAKNIKPIRTVTSNLVKNVTSLGSKTLSKPQTSSRTPAGRCATTPPGNSLLRARSAPAQPQPKKPVVLERQATFTKEQDVGGAPKAATKIPLPSAKPSKIAKPIAPTPAPTKSQTVVSKLRSFVSPKPASAPAAVARNSNSLVKSQSTDRVVRKTGLSRLISYKRSPSDDRDDKQRSAPSRIPGSASSQSLKSTASSPKRSLTPVSTVSTAVKNRSSSNGSISSVGAKKKVETTSKIASIWKKIEETKKQQNLPNAAKKKDGRVWIGGQKSENATEPAKLIRSSTYDTIDRPKEGLQCVAVASSNAAADEDDASF